MRRAPKIIFGHQSRERAPLRAPGRAHKIIEGSPVPRARACIQEVPTSVLHRKVEIGRRRQAVQ